MTSLTNDDVYFQDGDFLVRESQGSPGQYVLTGMQSNSKKHLLLVDPDGVVSLYYGEPGDSRSGYFFQGFSDYWCAPGVQSHLHVLGVTRGGELCFNGASAGHPLKCEGT